MKRLAIVSTHPIQYNAPLFQLLTHRGRISLKVFYTWSQSKTGNIFDPGFGISKAWDIPLLEGYEYHFSENTAKQPGSHHYKGMVNPHLIGEVTAFRPDAVMVYGWNFQSHLKLIRYFSGRAPVFFRGDSTLLNESKGFSLKKKLRRLFLRWMYSHIDHAFYAGLFNREYFTRHGLPEASLSFMPHAVDNDRFASYDTGASAALRKQAGIGENELVFLYAGKFERVKNPLLLVEAFRKLRHKNVHLVMVGSGELEEILKHASAGASSIHFFPFQNQRSIPAIYGMADVFVLPSVSETWGLSVNEAMAAGKAVLVSSQCGCSADLILSGENGFVFDSGNANDLARLMDGMVQQGKEGMKKLGQASKAIIARWNYEACAETIEETMNQLER